MALQSTTRVGKGRITYIPDVQLTETPDLNGVNVAQDVTVERADIGDVVSISAEIAGRQYSASAYVSAKNVVTVRIVAGAAGDPDAGGHSAHLTIFHRN